MSAHKQGLSKSKPAEKKPCKKEIVLSAEESGKAFVQPKNNYEVRYGHKNKADAARQNSYG